MVKKKNKSFSDTVKKYLKNNKIKCIIIAVYLLLAIVGLLLSRGVKINYNLSDYLGKDTETSIALEIMTDEFGMTGNVQVMLTNIDKNTASSVKDELSSIEGVLNVSFDPDSDTSYKPDSSSALFTILINGADHSDTAKYVINEIKTRLGEKYGTVELGGSTIEYNALRENTSKEMGLIIVLSITMAALLLLITASSWIEPLILLACSGIAIAINMGLNIFIGEISYITNSVSSILQLALSVDYSIVVLHTYRSEKKRAKNNTEAMRRAVRAVLNPVSASALTTIAGLVALLFMSFTIGFDIGIVLIKGIVVSAVTALTFLPVVVLTFDGLIKKSAKRPFVPKGKLFSDFAFKASKIVAPLVAIFVIAGSILQGFNSYGFTDSIGSNQNIEKIFGRNDSIVLVYKTGNAEEDYKKEILLKEKLLEYRNSEGENPLTGYTASSTTVKELYDVDKAIKVLGLGEGDVKLLFAMYNIYTEALDLKITPLEFVNYTLRLINSADPDVSGMVDEKTKDTIKLLADISELMSNDHTANELKSSLGGLAEGGGISDFAIKQIYGLYFDIAEGDKRINTKALCSHLLANVDKLNLSDEKEGILKSEKQIFIETMTLISGSASSSEALSYPEFHEKYSVTYGPVFSSEALTEQLFIMYLIDNGALANGIPVTENRISGRELVSFVLDTAKTNSVIEGQLEGSIDRLNDLVTVDECMQDLNKLTFTDMTERMNRLQSEIKSVSSSGSLDSEKISGVYIKYAISSNITAAFAPISAYNLVDFISENMETNSLLKGKMTEEHFAKVEDAKAMIAGAEELFISDNYSRVLLSARLPAEGPEMVAFIDYLLDSMHLVFGTDAHITGKVVSTYDLQAAFDVDNIIITVFTIVSILLVILFIFKSLSLPVILVLVIQGSVWISLSLCLIGGGLIFFMSYIVTTCILMGATVDYGILMSNNYLVYRKTDDKSTALAKAVDSAMPTVFTSGLILVVCGFVISLISSQNSIASVGSLLAQGTIISILMITLGLPSILFLLDKYILKLTMSDEQTAKVKANIAKLLDRFAKTKFGSKLADILKPVTDKVSKIIEKMKENSEEQKAIRRKQEIQEKRRRTIEAKKKAIAEAIAKGEPIPVTKKTPGRKPRKPPLTPEEARAIIEKKSAEKKQTKKASQKTNTKAPEEKEENS
ncbi:MAG: MMPL family transporter [Clostridia bacterium]|nr:MMPL family transporter [Clostridia bacterium]